MEQSIKGSRLASNFNGTVKYPKCPKCNSSLMVKFKPKSKRYSVCANAFCNYREPYL